MLDRRAMLYYNPKRHRYYEMVNGLERYAVKVSESTIAAQALSTDISNYRNPTEDKLDQIDDQETLPF
jgi:hypothetical protein